ncbi:MAG: cytidylate kinase family protein [Treponema sp.]|jgi:cytidylate kinase|nr:cytidylate kinase family protein [Treponema sp.]
MENKKIRIAISGKSGCGNTTVSCLTAEKLGIKFINFTFRSLAQEKGLDLRDVLEMAEKDDSWDREVDSRQVSLTMKESCVLGSRLAIWLLPQADLKVYLKASLETRAERIMRREGGILEEIARFTAERDNRDHERYLRLYGIDNDAFGFADLVVDTDGLSPEDIVKMITSRV